MHVILEYIAIGLILIFILFLTAQYISLIVTPLAETEAERITDYTESLMDFIITYAGDPPDWGSKFTQPNQFGLYDQNSTGEPYTLNVDKIARIANGSINGIEYKNPLYVDWQYTAEKLGIKESHGFKIEIKPSAAIDVEILERNINLDIPQKIKITAKSFLGTPMPGANITLYYFIITSLSGDPFEYELFSLSNITRINGECIIDFGDNLTSLTNQIAFVIVIRTDYFGSTAVDFYSENFEYATVIDGKIIANCTEIEDDKVAQIVPQVSKTVKNLFFVNATEESAINEYTVYKLDFVEPYSYLIAFIGYDDSGNQKFFIALRPPPVDYGYETIPRAAVACSTKTVYIEGYSYYIRLCLWRFAQP